MAIERPAFGAPGIDPRWTHGNKSGVGTAYSSSSRIWFTLFEGIVTEVYYPTVDSPQLRDIQLLITDGKTFCHDEKRDLTTVIEAISPHTLGYKITNSDPAGRYKIVKTVITDPHLPCLLQRTTVSATDPAFLSTLTCFALCAPHLDVGGANNNGYVATVNGQQILMAYKAGLWMAMKASVPFERVSCGYVGRSDGWTDLEKDFQMSYAFTRAEHGNIALTGEVNLMHGSEFTLALAFGNSEHRAITNVFQSLAVPFEQHLHTYSKQWERAAEHRAPLEKCSSDGGTLFQSSYSLLLAHEDKANPGALVASLAIPWGEAKGDGDNGGYHLVWTRDLVNCATALLAAGDRATPLRALVFLSVSQHADGGFAQNFWVDGEPYWTGVQLDEVAFPILLAWRLGHEGCLGDFDPFALVRKAAGFLLRQGPVTQQERWEEASGYSPSTLASNIAALICAATIFRQRGDERTATFLEEYADSLEAHVEDWTVTHRGTLLAGTPTHYIRILPEPLDADDPATKVDDRSLVIKNLAPNEPDAFPAKDVVDGGFLELVRYGIRAADHPIIADSVKVMDAVLKTETNAGPVWHRYNHDGYGQKADGTAFNGSGQGRAWPLLTGERGHYELAAGRDVTLHVKALEQLASATGLLPEQVWDEEDLPQQFLFNGKPTGSAMPLMWAHAEYIKLLRSVSDGKVYDLIPDVHERYVTRRKPRRLVEIWRPERRVKSFAEGSVLRVLGKEPFRLRWSADDWQSHSDTMSIHNALDIDFVDLPTANTRSAEKGIAFTFFWIAEGVWEGRNHYVSIRRQSFDKADRPTAK